MTAPPTMPPPPPPPPAPFRLTPRGYAVVWAVLILAISGVFMLAYATLPIERLPWNAWMLETPTPSITFEDSPDWDCRTMGNRRCAPSTLGPAR